MNLHIGDCLDVLQSIPDCSVDSVVTDPPYGLKFMGNHWDAQTPGVEVWRECLRVLKPGAYLLAFAGTRTQHRMAVNIEDAGFEIRDMIAWMYGQGMPKSGGLKPAHEPITLARKPGTPVKLNIDGCRVSRVCGDRVEYGVSGDEPSQNKIYGKHSRIPYEVHASGRHPANLIHDGSDEVVALFPNDNPGCKPHRVKASEVCVAAAQAKGWGFGGTDKVVGYDDGDNLSAARFFYCAKATKKDRGGGNDHPTVKPTDLMRYLCRLVTPHGGVVLDPFMGSGSTGKAAALEGFQFIGIDKEPRYVEIAKRRIESVRGVAQ